MSKPSYAYEQHPRAQQRKDEHPAQKPANEQIGLNERVGLVITKGVGTMWAAYAFFALTLVSLPAAIASGQGCGAQSNRNLRGCRRDFRRGKRDSVASQRPG
jgi:hypothetical protein